ncbi:MAG: hypothetical protein IH862_11295 [Chloroflexi bacterium]|nr:hypothetical protein [Chloroflexota bacterium]
MARAKKQFIVDEQGRKTAIILPIKEYEELLEDLAIIAERRHEPTEPLEVVIARLEKKWRNTGSR